MFEHFDIKLLVLATPERWEMFSRALSGRAYHVIRRQQSPVRRLGSALKTVVLRRFSSDTEKKRRAQILELIGSRNTPIARVFDVNSGPFLQELREINPDMILSAAYPQIFGAPLIGIPQYGAVNFHPSLLPSFRGAHPHFWAIAKGAAESGVSAHFMTERIDDGPLLAWRKVPIADVTYSQFYQLIIAETPPLVEAVAAFLADPGRHPLVQDESRAMTFQNDREIHRRVFWSLHSAEEVRNLVRTESAFCFFRNERIDLGEAVVLPTNRNLTNNVRVEPGTIVDILKDHVVVKATDQCVGLARLAGPRGPLPAPAWAKKVGLQIGEKFH
jgi:methionyl-tRNA formyltransferase